MPLARAARAREPATSPPVARSASPSIEAVEWEREREATDEASEELSDGSAPLPGPESGALDAMAV
jgi:hypothetical protein